jgi:hypothetical protein
MLLACRLAGLSALASSQWRNLPFHPRAPVFISRPLGVLACRVSRFAKWATRSFRPLTRRAHDDQDRIRLPGHARPAEAESCSQRGDHRFWPIRTGPEPRLAMARPWPAKAAPAIPHPLSSPSASDPRPA